MTQFLADTHIFLWWIQNSKKLSSSHARALKGVSPDNPLLISDITIWEIGLLVKIGRIQIDRPLRDWLVAATAPPLVEIIPISPAIVSAVVQLPTTFQRDPADQIIFSTAQILGAKLLTEDRSMLEFLAG